MRHRSKVNPLGRTKEHRKAMLANMASSLILRKRLYTTVAKAKALRSFIEPLITRSKTDTTHSRRMVFRRLQNKLAVTELFRNISQKIAERPGGYTRILKAGFRPGDNAEMCYIELVDFNTAYQEASTKEKKGRRRRGKKKTKEELQNQQVHKQQDQQSLSVDEASDASPANQTVSLEQTDVLSEKKDDTSESEGQDIEDDKKGE